MENEKRKLWKKVLPVVLAVALVTPVVFYSFTSASADNDETETAYRETQVMRGDLTVGISESGTASLEAVEITYDDYSSTSSDDDDSNVKTVIEEIYVKAGQKVVTGDPIAKMNTEAIEEDLEELRMDYERAVISLENAQMEQQLQTLSAESTYRSNQLLSETAERSYELSLDSIDSSIASYSDNVDSILDEIEDKEDEIDELEDQMDTYEDEYEALEQQIDDLIAGGAAEDDTNVAELREQADAAYESYKSYKERVEDAEDDLSDLQSQKTSALISYQQAVNSQDLETLEAELQLTEDLYTSENADTLYEIELAQLENEVASAQLNLETIEDQIATLENYLTDGMVKATCDGLIMDVYYIAGEKVSSDATICTIANSDNVYISVSIDQEDIAELELGKEANISFSAYPDTKFTGVIDSISVTPAMTGGSTVSYTVNVKLDGDASNIYEGMTGDVTFITKEIQDVIYVSNRAVYSENGKEYVKIRNEAGEVEEVEVVTGFSDGSNVEIVSGLSEGDTALIESVVTAS